MASRDSPASRPLGPVHQTPLDVEAHRPPGRFRQLAKLFQSESSRFLFHDTIK